MIGFRRTEVVELSGIKIPLDTSVFSTAIISAIKGGWYEREEATHLPAIIEDGERVLEIGAGIGYVSSLVARDPRTAAVRVFEANPLLMPMIRKVHRINRIKGVQLRNGVLSHDTVNSTSKFYVREDFWASSLVEKPWGYDRVIDVSNVSFAVELADFRPSLIICDIEGGELALFENADLDGVNKLFMEVHQEVLGRAGMKRLFESMSAQGFHYDQYHSCGAVILFSRVDLQGLPRSHPPGVALGHDR